MTARGQQLAVAITCFVAALTYAGTVTTHGMTLYVLPGVVGAALFGSLLVARRMYAAALIVGGLLALGWAELVNIWSGTADGPAARSAFFAAGWTLIAIVAAQSRWPALFLAGVAGIVVGALDLGAAGEVLMVSVATAICAALTLGLIERSRRNWTARPQRGLALVLLSLLAGAAAIGGVLLQTHQDLRKPVLSAQGHAYPRIKPGWTDPLITASNALGRKTARQPKSQPPHRASKPATKPATRPHPTQPASHTSRSMWFYVLAAIALVLLILAVLIAARLLSTRLAWRRVRRRLAAGTAAEQVTGAWAWTRMRLEACRLPLPVDVSPDVVVARRGVLATHVKVVADELAKHGYASGNVATASYTPLQTLAAAATTAAFAPVQSLGPVDAAAAWAAAEKADGSARKLLSRSGRALLAFRPPASASPSGSRNTSALAAITMGASGLALCFAILAGGKGAVPTVSTAPSPVTTPTTQHAARVSPTQAPPDVLAPREVPAVRGRKAPRHALASPVPAPSQLLAPGSIGPQVTILQRALAVLGFSTGQPDGQYGPATQSAVARFQASKGLPQIGIVGPQTLAALQQALSRRSAQ